MGLGIDSQPLEEYPRHLRGWMRVRWLKETPRIAPQAAAAAAGDPFPLARAVLAYRADCPDVVLEVLSRDKVPAVVVAVASTAANLPFDLAGRLARNYLVVVRQALAARDGLWGLVLLALANDESPVVRATVAARPRLPLEYRPSLALDADPRVRAALAEAHASSHARLATDRRVRVRLGVARCPDAGDETLRALSVDRSRVVAREAQTALAKRGNP